VTDTTLTLADWLLRTALGGAAVLTLGRVALAFASAAEARHRLAAATLRVAAIVPLLALLPAWWTLPSWQPTPTPIEVTPIQAYPETVDLPAWDGVPVFAEPLPETVPESAGAPAAEPVEARSHWPGALAVVAAAYVAVGTLFLAEFVVGLLALARLRRHSTPAPTRLSALAAGVVGRAALRVTSRLGSPVCFGVLRPTVVLPAVLADRATAAELTWVLAHEAEHLRRGDPLTGWFAGLSKALYFFAPAFWAVRRELRLSQEFLADAAAIRAGGSPADYAEFLITLTADPTLSRPTRLAHGVRARPTELTRRILMVLSTTPSRRRAATLWTTPVGAALVATAALLSGVALVNADDKKPDDKPAKARVIVVRGDDAKTADGDKPAEVRRIVITVDDLEKIEGKASGLDDLVERLARAAKSSDPEKLRALVAEVQKAVEAKKAAAPKQEGDKPEPRAVIVRRIEDLKPAEARKAEPDQPQGDVLRLARKPLSPEATQKFLDRITEAAKANDPVKLQAVLDEYQKAMAANTVRYFAAPPTPPVPPVAPRPPVPGLTWVQPPTPPGFGKPGVPPAALKKMLEGVDDPAQRDRLEKALKAADGALNLAWVDGSKVLFASRPLLGLSVAPVPEAVAAHLNLPAKQGLLVVGVAAESPAGKAGVQKNDVLTKINGEAVGSIEELTKLASAATKNGSATVTVIHGGKEKTLTVTFPKPAAAKPNPTPAKESTVQFQSMQMQETKLDADPEKIDAKYRPAVKALLKRLGDK
jgi:beta-lactamase regulating signal transducer with metallopeptidase domain